MFLKSNRCRTSFAAWFRALSTSWRSTLLTMSNELSDATVRTLRSGLVLGAILPHCRRPARSWAAGPRSVTPVQLMVRRADAVSVRHRFRPAGPVAAQVAEDTIREHDHVVVTDDEVCIPTVVWPQGIAEGLGERLSAVVRPLDVDERPDGRLARHRGVADVVATEPGESELGHRQLGTGAKAFSDDSSAQHADTVPPGTDNLGPSGAWSGVLLFAVAAGRARRHGRLPEWPKGAVCKTVGIAYVGSNPTPATRENGL